MRLTKTVKIILVALGTIGVLLFGLWLYAGYWFNRMYTPTDNSYTQRVGYIDPKTSLLSEGFETCNEWILDYYNPEHATYSKGKNGLRTFILSNYKNDNYSDSGYLNIRFVINCNGQAGRYVIYENDLDLNPAKFSEELRNQLFQLTTQLKKWNPNLHNGEAMDSYMYVSYRIENGEITEILP